MKYIKEDLKDRVPYYSAMITDGVILNANESCFDTPKEIKEFASKYIMESDLKRYPDTDCLMLRKSLAKKYNVDVNNIMCGVGSDQLLDCVFRSIVDNEYVLIANPTFSMYKEYCSYTNGKIIEIDFKENFVYDTDKILEGIQKYNPKLVIICSPNNPTGSIMEKEDVIRVINEAKGIVLIDEAYGEFMGYSLVDLATCYDNVIVLKTFSKAYALAGIRVGYAISTKDNIDMLNIVKPPYNLSSLSIAIASYAIDNAYLYSDSVKRIMDLRLDLYNALKGLNIEVYPSNANFLWVKLKTEIYENLLRNKIYIRKLLYNKDVYYRITVGTSLENDLLLRAIKEVLS